MPASPSLATGRRNARILAVCQGLFIAAISIDLTLTALTGHMLAPDKALSTLPFALITVAGALVTWFASLLMQRIGRRNGFALGALAGAAGGGISVWAVFQSDFWMFCAGTALVGVFQAFAQYYRLAAADAVEPAAKSRAISVVMTGGVIAAIAGPALAAWSRDLFAPVTFAGAYLMVALLALLSAALLFGFYRDIDTPEMCIRDRARPAPSAPPPTARWPRTRRSRPPPPGTPARCPASAGSSCGAGPAPAGSGCRRAAPTGISRPTAAPPAAARPARATARRRAAAASAAPPSPPPAECPGRNRARRS